MSSQFETSKSPIAPPAHEWVGWVLGGVTGAVLFMLVAGALSLQTADLSKFAKPIAAAVRKTTGRELEIGKGPIIRMSLPLSIVAENVILSNAAWGTRPEMLRVRRVELEVRALPLLLKRFVIHRLTLDRPDLLIETDPQGKGNWVLDVAPGHQLSGIGPSPGSSFSRLALREIRLSGATLTYHDGCGGWKVGVVVPRLSVVPSWKGAGRLIVDGTLALPGATISVAGTIGGPENRPFPVKLAFSTNGATGELEGSVRRLPELAGVDLGLGITISDGPAFGAVLGVSLPKLPPFRLDARVRDSGPGWTLEPLRCTAGSSSLSGTVGYAFGCPRSRLTVDLRGGRLDLAELSGTPSNPVPGRTAFAAPGRAVFPRAPLPLDALNSLDASVGLRLDAVRLPSGTEARSLEAHATLAGGQLDIERFAIELGGGHVTGSLQVRSGRKSGFTAKADGSRVELAALLGAAGTRADVERAATDLAIALTGGGPSLHQWMASLGGNLRIVVGPGSLQSRTLTLGGDVLAQALAAVNPDRAGADRTDLRCAVINVPVSGGVAQLDQSVAAETSRFNLTVSGSVDLGKELLDLDLRSRATQGLGIGLANLATLARVRGPLASPALTLDPQDALQTAYSLRSLFKTRGRSLVQDQVRARAFPESPCATALRGGTEKHRSLLDLFRNR